MIPADFPVNLWQVRAIVLELLGALALQRGLVSIFLLTRLGGRSGPPKVFLTISIVLWNTGIMLGLIGIMVGEQLPYAWLEFPAFVGPVLFIAFVGVGLSCLMIYHARAYRSSYASQWWVLAALFSFAWIYSAQSWLFTFGSGHVQAPIKAGILKTFWAFLGTLAFATISSNPKNSGSHVIGYKHSAYAFGHGSSSPVFQVCPTCLLDLSLFGSRPWVW